MIPYNEIQQKYFSISNTRTLIYGGVDIATVSSAELLASLGSEVLYVSPRSERLLYLRETWQTRGFPITTLAYDTTMEPGELFRAVKQKVNIVNFVLHSINLKAQERLLLCPTEEFEYGIHQSITQLVNTCQYSYPLLKMAKSPSIVCLVVKPAADSKLLPLRDFLAQTVTNMAQTLGKEMAQDNIRINAIVYQETLPQQAGNSHEISNNPLQFEQVAQLISLLYYPAASGLTGQCFWIDGSKD
jgi:enoyl-[acyl-carrier-protein] reductase (NADH)